MREILAAILISLTNFEGSGISGIALGRDFERSAVKQRCLKTGLMPQGSDRR